MLHVSFSIYCRLLKVAVNNSQNRWEWFSFVDKYSFFGDKIIYVYQLHRERAVLNLAL